jgi:predicted HTH transcriptional regulator
MDQYKLLGLIKQSESTRLDFKLCLDLSTESMKKELAKDVCALANSASGRGYIIFGVEDKTKRLVGIQTERYVEEQIQQVISQRLDPPVNIRLEHIALQGVQLAVLTVFYSFKKPHQLRQTGAFYIRRGSTTDFARREEIANMLQHEGLLFNELIPLNQLNESALNRLALDHYLKSQWADGDFRENLIRLGILCFDRFENSYAPTVGGLLLFGQEPQLHLPHTGIHIVNLLGAKKESYTVRGTILEMLDKAVDIVELSIKFSHYPKGVYQEAIANALVHRDYFDTSRQITIFITSKRLEISNPGASYEQEKPEGVSRERNPYRRNMWLYDRLMALDEQKRFNESGIGLIRMKKALENKGRIKIISSKKANLFKLIITLNEHQAKTP